MPSPHSRLSRRQVLAASAAVPAVWLSGACTVGGGDRSPSPTPQAESGAPAEDPDVVVLAGAVAWVEDLLTLLEQAVSEREGLTDVLEPLLANHRRHAEVLSGAGPGSGTGEQPASTPTGSPTGSPGEMPTLPRRRGRLLAHLAEQEQRAADAHIRQVRETTSGQFAALLAAISASESQHAAVLREAAG